MQFIHFHPVQKSYRTLQVETSQQKAFGNFHWETTGFSDKKFLFRLLDCFVQWYWVANASDTNIFKHFYFGFGITDATLQNKMRLQQAISEQSVIIVTRLLHCSRRSQRKEKYK
jgi:hypothetical protein